MVVFWGSCGEESRVQLVRRGGCRVSMRRTRRSYRRKQIFFFLWDECSDGERADAGLW